MSYKKNFLTPLFQVVLKKRNMTVNKTINPNIYIVLEYKELDEINRQIKGYGYRVYYNSKHKICHCDEYYNSLKHCQHIHAVKMHKANKFLGSGERSPEEEWTLIINNFRKVIKEINDEEDKGTSGYHVHLIVSPFIPWKLYNFHLYNKRHRYFRLKKSLWSIMLMLKEDHEFLSIHQNLEKCILNNHDHKHKILKTVLEVCKNQVNEDRKIDEINDNDYKLIEEVIKDKYCSGCTYNNCNKEIKKRCKRCGCGYCSKRHQKKDWNRNSHSSQCQIRCVALKKWIK